MTIKLIGAGFGRTGTTSIKAALEELGLAKCYHMTEVFFNPSHVPFWVEATEKRLRGEPVGGWDAVFDGYQATVDWPACTFYKELMERYPDAKVLLTVRDPERWYDSTLHTIYPIHESLFGLLIRIILPFMRPAKWMIDNLVWAHTFDGRFEDREAAIERFNQHIEEVKAHVPAEKLLVYSVKEGWEPLCAFLGVPVPDKPFPHLNDKKMIQRAMRFGPAVILGGAAALVAIAFWVILSWTKATIYKH